MSLSVSLSSWLNHVFWMPQSSKLNDPLIISKQLFSISHIFMAKVNLLLKMLSLSALPSARMEHVFPWNLLTLVKKSAMCHLFPYCLKTSDIASIITEPVRGCRKATWSTKQTRHFIHFPPLFAPNFVFYPDLSLENGFELRIQKHSCINKSVWGRKRHRHKERKHLSPPGDSWDQQQPLKQPL